MQNTNVVNFKDVFKVIWSRKYWLMLIMICVGAISVAILLEMDNIYESKAILKAQDMQSNTRQLQAGVTDLANLAGINVGSGVVPVFDNLNAVLNDTVFITNFVKKNKFEHFLIEDYKEKSQDKSFNDNINFHLAKAVSAYLIFSQDERTGIMSLSFRSYDRHFSKQMVDAMLVALSLQFKNNELSSLQQQIDRYKMEIDNTPDITLKNKLANLVSNLIQNKVIAQSHKYYGFDVIVEPRLPDQLDKVGPKRFMILQTVLILTIVLSILFFLILDLPKENKR